MIVFALVALVAIAAVLDRLIEGRQRPVKAIGQAALITIVFAVVVMVLLAVDKVETRRRQLHHKPFTQNLIHP